MLLLSSIGVSLTQGEIAQVSIQNNTPDEETEATSHFLNSNVSETRELDHIQEMGTLDYAKLQIAISDGLTEEYIPFEANQIYTYTITVTNPNSQSVSNVSIIDFLPSEVQFHDCSPGGMYENSTHTVEWNVSFLDASLSVEAWVEVRMKEGFEAQYIINNASARSNATLTNWSTILSMSFEANPPTCSVNVQGPTYHRANHTYYSDETALELLVIDDFAGIKDLSYSFDSNPPTVSSPTNHTLFFSEQINLNILSEGSHSLEYIATDNFQNPSNPFFHDFLLDSQPPNIEIDGFSGGDFIGLNHRVWLNSSDALVGVRYVLINCSKAQMRVDDNSPRDKNAEEGKIDVCLNVSEIVNVSQGFSHQLSINAFDFLSSKKSKIWALQIDVYAPEVEITVDEPKLNHTIHGLMVDDQTLIHFNSSDFGSGLDYMHYKLYKKSSLSDPYTMLFEDDFDFDSESASLLSRIRSLLKRFSLSRPAMSAMMPLDDPESHFEYRDIPISLSEIPGVESAWYQIHCYAVDEVGNQGLEETLDALLDMDAPISHAVLDGLVVVQDGLYWLTRNVSFFIHCNDVQTPIGIGANHSVWTIKKLDATVIKDEVIVDQSFADNNSDFGVIEFSFDCDDVADGLYHVFFYGVDSFGNKESEVKYPIGVDNTAPTISETPTLLGPSSDGQNNTTSHVLPTTWVELQANDAGVGLDYLHYEIWKDGYFVDGDDELFGDVVFNFDQFGFGNGEYVVKWSAVDLLNNSCMQKSWFFVVDDMLPLISVSINGSAVVGTDSEPDYWIRSDTQIIINVTGLGDSPQNNSKYRLNHGPWIPIIELPYYVTLPDEGRFELDVHTTDGLNPSMKKTVFFVDNTAPEMTIMEPRTGHGIFYKNNSRLSSVISSLDVVNPDPNCEEVGIHDGHPGNAVLIDVMDGFDTFCLKSGCFEYDGDEQLFTGSFIITDGLTVGDGEFLYVPFVSDELYNYNDIRFELEQIYNNSGGNVAQFKSQILPYVDSHRVEWLYMDNTPPVVNIETPSPGGQIFGNNFLMDVNVFDALSGVPAGSSVYVTLDGIEIGVLSVDSDNGHASGTLLIPATMPTKYDVELLATVYDDAGNSASDTIVIDVIRDAQTPVVEILSPSNGSQVTDSFEVSVHAMDVDTTVQNLSVQLEINPSTASSWSIDLSYDSGYFVGLVNISSLLNATTIELTASASDESNNTGVSDTVEIIVFSDVENRPPQAPSSPIPSDDALNVSLDVLLQWSCSDADGDAITYDCYLGNSSGSLALVEQNVSSKSFLPSNLNHNNTYYWKVVAWDENNAQNQSPIWSFSTSTVNQPPRTPSSPNPSNSSESRPIDSTVLSWSCSDADMDQLTYAVFFGKNQNPMLKNNSLTSKSFDPGVLEYNTTYYWRINVSDDNGHYVEGPLWQFTTDLEEDGYLWADAGGPYTGFVGDTLEFDASSSTTENGTSITGYKWDFDGDMIYDTEWSNTSTTSHSYSIAGTYTVFVKIKNNLGDLAVHQSSVVISEESNVVLSNPPSKPIVTGPTRGRSNTVYQFNVTATDPDGDTIKIQASWGSMGDNTESQSFSSGQTITLTHSFSATKVYTLSFKAIDENGVVSQSTIYNIEINTIVLDGYGDLLDYDGDGVFDKFKPSGQAMSLQTEVGREDGMIGFDVDGDEEFDYIYDSSNDVVSEWKKDSPAAGGLRLPIPLWLIALIAAVIVVAVVLFFFSGQIKEKLSSTNKKPSKKKTNNGQQQINLPTQSNSGGGSGFKRL